MNYEEFKKQVIEFFQSINTLILTQYKDKLSVEKFNELQNFNTESIVFYDIDPTDKDNNKLYVNNNYFKNDDVYDISKLENTKRQFLEKYFEKFIIFDYSKDKERLMMKYAVEEECNKFINNNNLNINLSDTYQKEYILVLIKNKIGNNYEEILYKKDIETLLNFLNDENLKQEYLKLENKEIDKKDEEEQLATIYGIDLEDIEVINVKDKKYYKIKKDNNYYMIESNTKLSIVEEFKQYQEESIEYQTEDSKINSANIADTMINNKINVQLIPINDLERYQLLLNSLSIEQMNCVKVLYLNKDKYNIDLINVNDGLAIDKTGKCLFAEKNEETNQYEIKYAKTDVYDEKENKNEIKTESENSNSEEDLSNSSQIEDTIDNPNEIQKEEKLGNQKKLVYRPNQNGFIDVLILSLITGLEATIAFLIIFLKIK